MFGYSLININTLKIAVMVITLILLTLIFVIISMVLRKKNKKWIINKVSIIIVLLFCMCCVDLIPFVKFLIQFKSSDQIFHYYHPMSKIVKKYEFDDYVYIYSKDNTEYYVKSNNRWRLPYKKEKPISINKWCNKNMIQIDQYPDKDLSVVMIIYSKVMDDPKNVKKNRKVSDSLSTKFDMVMEDIETTKHSGLITADYFAIIPQKLDNDYTIYIDGVQCRSLLD